MDIIHQICNILEIITAIAAKEESLIMSKVNRVLEMDNEDNFSNGLLLRVFNQESLFEPRMIAVSSYERSPTPEIRRQIAQEDAELCAAIHDKILEENPEYGALYEQYACAVRKLLPLKVGRTETEEKGSTLTKVFCALKLLKALPPAVTASIAESKMHNIFKDYCKSNRPSVR